MILRGSPSSWFHRIVRTPAHPVLWIKSRVTAIQSVLPLNDILSPRFMVLILGRVLTKLPSLASNPFNSPGRTRQTWNLESFCFRLLSGYKYRYSHWIQEFARKP